MNDKQIAIFSDHAITPLRDIKKAVVVLSGEKILDIGKRDEVLIPPDCEIMDVGNKIIAPGFIDIHNHGGSGKMVDEGGRETVRVNSKRLIESGCTTWLPTVDSLYGVKEVVASINEKFDGACIGGIHMEGPFLYPKDIENIQGIDFGLVKPSLEKLHEFFEASEGHLKVMGVSIELEGAESIIKEIASKGIIPAIAHSTKASYELFLRSVDWGIKHVTHTYNVMSGLHHRRPGVVGGALTCMQVTNEIISDGFHVSPVAIEILLRCKGVDQICVITDNTSVAGLPDGEYEMAGAKLIKKNGVTRYLNSTDELDHTMAGSEWPINHNVRFLINELNVNLSHAIQMATLNPARIVGLDHSIGSLEVGKEANLIVVDPDMNIFHTFVRGKQLFKR